MMAFKTVISEMLMVSLMQAQQQRHSGKIEENAIKRSEHLVITILQVTQVTPSAVPEASCKYRLYVMIHPANDEFYENYRVTTAITNAQEC
jgi:hypothetical protein